MARPPRFLINKNGVYYLTSGRLKLYDAKATGGDPDKTKGVNDTWTKFLEKMNSSNTLYGAVEITEADFEPLNTGTIE